MIGQVLTGPDGWLADRNPSDVLVVRLADTIHDIGKAPEPDAGNTDRLASYAEEAAGSETLSRLVHRNSRNQHAALLCVDLMPANCGFTDRFLRARGGWLREDERKLIESWRDIPIGVFEVRKIHRGTGVTVHTLPGGEPDFLKDRLFSTHVNRLDRFCGRLFTDGARPRLLALPARVQREEREELLKLLDSRPSAKEIAEFFGPPGSIHDQRRRPRPFRHRGGLGNPRAAGVGTAGGSPGADGRGCYGMARQTRRQDDQPGKGHQGPAPLDAVGQLPGDSSCRTTLSLAVMSCYMRRGQ